ncbi:putative short-chain dehydrogenase [Xylariomycetidae sp. FL2044]|nr:putative short-chain dehydrogenase [Xylariomycetidae sp. FL2044]KAH9906077.1 putative short-chain dehydrogenase [Xylariomycetidae sp. FL2044]
MGTVILTGANSSLAIPAAAHLLESYPDLTLVLAVRNSTESDVNTAKLREVLARFPDAKVSIFELDLADLANVRRFADQISSSVASGRLPPLKSIVCNAFYWNLVADPELTVDGYDRTLQVAHIGHAALVLRLLGHFAPDGGRIVLLSSVNHWPGKAGVMEKYPAEIPADLDALVHPQPDADREGRGNQRYGTSKLVVTTWMYALNRCLERQSDRLRHITAVAIDPGILGDSRAYRTNTPGATINLQRFILRPFLPLLQRFVDTGFRRAAEAGVDVAELAADRAYPGERGFFKLLKKDTSAPQSLDEDVQRRIWQQSLAWAKITQDDTALALDAGF